MEEVDADNSFPPHFSNGISKSIPRTANARSELQERRVADVHPSYNRPAACMRVSVRQRKPLAPGLNSACDSVAGPQVIKVLTKSYARVGRETIAQQSSPARPECLNCQLGIDYCGADYLLCDATGKE